MRGIDPLIGTVLVIAITIAAITIVLNAGLPATEKTKEIMIFDELKSNMILLSSKINEVALQGEGSSSRLNLIINGGQYNISSDGIRAVMDSKYQIVGVNASYVEGDIAVSGEAGKVALAKSYSGINIVGGGAFGRGNYNINIKNERYDSGLGKQIINVTIS